jgi:CRISPR-associated endonuclease Csn1
MHFKSIVFYRLSLDIGSNSIGWCVIALDASGHPIAILGAGVRVFPDGRHPKSLASLAGERRLARSMRRNRDRYLRRRERLLAALTRFGLMPADAADRALVAARDPYDLRARALVEPLDRASFGRVLFHLNQHRGFKSNRKVDRRGDNNPGLVERASRDLSALLGDRFPTLGAFLADRHRRREGVRVRLAGSGKAAAYPFYPLRSMVEAEFDAVWAAQAAFDPTLTTEMRDALRHIIFHQRDLRDPPVGRCWLEPTQNRAWRALPSVQAFRIAQDLAHLRIEEPGMPSRALSSGERTILFDRLTAGHDIAFGTVRKRLKLAADTRFNLESGKRDKLEGAKTAERLRGEKSIGPKWTDLSLDVQDAVVLALIDSPTDAAALAELVGLGIDAKAAERAVATSLPDGTASLSLAAIRRILPHLRAGLRYDEAVKAADFPHHSDNRTGEVLDRLPYYGEVLHERIGTGTGKVTDSIERRWGRAPNPTVHVALNEVRRVVNAIIDRHGAPTEIVVETLRDLGQSAIGRREEDDRQKTNQKANEGRAKILKELDQPDNGRNRMRLRLWQEQAEDPKLRVCPYSGTLITCRMALSGEIEDDHILPFAITLDDSAANRVLVTREMNRRKARQSPFDAFGHTDIWPGIQQNIAHLPLNKRWRFAPDALDRVAETGDFLARHLTDSAIVARLARMYLEGLAPGRVWSVPGRLTAMLRSHLGLDGDAVLGRGGRRKDRTDHRHNAIDAIVVGLTDRGLLQRVSGASRRGADEGRRVIGTLDPPWEGFVADVARTVRGITVSYKQDHGWQGALHNDQAYGLVDDGGDPRRPNSVIRRPLETFADKGWTAVEIAKAVRDPRLAERIIVALDGLETVPLRKAALARLTHTGGHRVGRVRMVERLNNARTITDGRTGRPYKRVKLDANHRIELWRLPNGTARLLAVSVLDAAREAAARAAGQPPVVPRGVV